MRDYAFGLGIVRFAMLIYGVAGMPSFYEKKFTPVTYEQFS